MCAAAHERQLALAKLTVSLRVTGLVPHGRHLLDAEMVTIDLADELTFSDGDGLVVTGPCAGGVPDDDTNLVRRALVAVDRRAQVRLEKHIPAGAGLGGGSADAGAVLRWAGCRDIAVAAALGSDVPFCVVGGRARISGVGEVIEPLPFEDRVYTLLIPPLALSTAAVYQAWDELGGRAAAGSNDLEPAALRVEPALARWRDRLESATGQQPRLAGSGATWFVEGAFPGGGRIVVRTAQP